MPYKVALTGRFRTGKDTVADLLTKLLPNSVTRLAFAGALKEELASMLYNYTTLEDMMQQSEASKSPQDDYDKFAKQMLDDRDVNGLGWQWLGAWRRQHSGEDYWVDHPYFVGAYARACDHEQNILITDMRHRNEAAWCRNNGFFLVRVEGPCRAANEQRDPNHPSERYVSELDVHATIANMYDLVHLGEAVAELYKKQIVPFFRATAESSLRRPAGGVVEKD